MRKRREIPIHIFELAYATVSYEQGRRHGFEGGGVQFVFLNPAKKIFLGPPTFLRTPPLLGGSFRKVGGS